MKLISKSSLATGCVFFSLLFYPNSAGNSKSSKADYSIKNEFANTIFEKSLIIDTAKYELLNEEIAELKSLQDTLDKLIVELKQKKIANYK